MRLQYRLLVLAAALVVAAATFYPLPMEAGPAGESGGQDTLSQAAGAVQESYAFDVPPSLLKTAYPSYPDEANKLGIEATVMLSLLINDEGAVKETTVLPVDPNTKDAVAEAKLEGEAIQKMDKEKLTEMRAAFEKSASEAAMKWKFKPAMLREKPVKARVAVPVRFKLH